MKSMPSCEFKLNFKMSPLTTFRIGGLADVVAWPKTAQELIDVIGWAKSEGLGVTFLGGGSNILISDQGIRGLVILSTRMDQILCDEEFLEVEFGSGCSVQRAVFWAAERSFSGLEFAGGLPGSLGGAVWMNARAYGGEVSQIVTKVEAVNQENEIEVLENAQMEFEYKRSVFQKRPLYITRCWLKFQQGEKEEILRVAQKNIADRRSKKQADIFSAGCAFKNNYSVGIPSGKLIQDAGLKGTVVGGARILEEHANFFINANHATAEDVIALMKLAQKTVREKFHVDIYPEVQFIGDFGDLLVDLKQG